MPYGAATEAKIAEVVSACTRYGGDSIIALSGVPGTGKSFVAGVAAQRLATTPLMVREIQFHPTFSYEEFIEGYRASAQGGFRIEKGLFLEWNDQAIEDKDNNYVLLIEELTRANLPAVLGELMTYIEHRGRTFTSLYSRRPVKIAERLIILATFNPRDRSALELDDAIVRRLRIIPCPPDTGQLAEMPKLQGLSKSIIAQMKKIFDVCQDKFRDEYSSLMPFGHGIFADIRADRPDLGDLWRQRIEPLLKPPGRQPHPFYELIADHYPWKDAPPAAIQSATSDPAVEGEAT